jgi:uncharacterized protein
MTAIVRRLQPGSDLNQEIRALSDEIAAGAVVSAVGSLTECQLRMAGADSTKTIMGPLEIVSITGTLGAGSHHIHLSVSNNDGTVFGGHLVDGCKVFTTVELVVMDLSGDWKFNRTGDARTGYPELDPTKSSPT